MEKGGGGDQERVVILAETVRPDGDISGMPAVGEVRRR